LLHLIPRPPSSPPFPYTTLFRPPRRMVLAVPSDPADLPPALAEKVFPAAAQGAVAYICKGSTCSTPVASLSGLVSRLRAGVQERSEEHTSELQSLTNLVCRLLLE